MTRIAACCAALALAACASRGSRPPYHRVTPAVAFEMLRDNPDLLVLDVRPPEEFHGPLGHLWGAVNIPLDQLEGRLGGLRPLVQQLLLVYCGRGSCGVDAMVHLEAAGFSLAVLLDGGIDAWVEDGFGTLEPGTRGHDESERARMRPIGETAPAPTPTPAPDLPRRRG
ncbi:MAG TPA: rhodanese-like domain-containing protein [Thermoanaerobaculia bacterium]|nr:rhodanese-like domain-containing protein [Thermoanaerobaculia bacterium]